MTKTYSITIRILSLLIKKHAHNFFYCIQTVTLERHFQPYENIYSYFSEAPANWHIGKENSAPTRPSAPFFI